MCPPTGIAHFVSGGLLAAFYVRDLVLTADGWVPTSPEIVAQDRAYLFTSATAFGNLVRTSLDSAATLGDSWRYLSPTVSRTVVVAEGILRFKMPAMGMQWVSQQLLLASRFSGRHTIFPCPRVTPQVLLTLPGGNQNVSLLEATSTLEAATTTISTMPLANITTSDSNVMVSWWMQLHHAGGFGVC